MTAPDPVLDLPEPWADDVIALEPLWYRFAAGADRPAVPEWTWTDEPPKEDHVPPPPGVRTGARQPLPFGVAERLGGVRFPDGRVPGPSGVDGSSLDAVLAAAFGVQWHDPANRYSVHRGYASPRCMYPVHVFVDDRERWWVLEPERHARAELVGSVHHGRSRRVLLAGRYVELPRGYKWLRGSLVNLELGITLRALAVALELFGVTGRLRLPTSAAAGRLADLGVDTTGEWSLPLTVDLDPPTATPDGPAVRPPEPVDDAALADLVAVNREQDFHEPPAPLGAAIPSGTTDAGSGQSWAEVMWRRNSGRMPRGLLGMSARRRRLPPESVQHLLRWLSVPPPGAALRSAFDAVTVTVAVQDVDGRADGVYRARAGGVDLHRADPAVAARLESTYVHALSPQNGCDVRHASMVWLLSVRPREVVDAAGPGGWTAVQYACGWAMHGLCLAAASIGLFARPVRAFREAPTRRIVGLGPDEMIVFSAVVGTPRHPATDLLDIRL